MNNGNGNEKCTKEMVYDFLSDKQWHTTTEIANEFSVSSPTIGSRVKQLVSDGLGILAGHDGYKLMEKEDIVGEEDAIEIEKMLRRMMAIVLRQALVAKPMKTLIKEANKLLPKDPKEKMIIRRYFVQLTHLIDFQELDDI